MKGRTDKTASGILDTILEQKRIEIARMLAAPQLFPRRSAHGGAAEALARLPGQPLRLACEIKRRSPSAGALSVALSAPDRALRYARAGAALISVLTDSPFFGGTYSDLAACRDALDAALGDRRPLLLCKDFILHPIQLDRALDAGADAVLVIARIVLPAQLQSLCAEARNRGLEPLVEIATQDEIAPALDAGARVVGVNARDLDTLAIDPVRAAEIVNALSGRAVVAHFSGLRTPQDVAAVAAGPAALALVGEALMRQDDPSELLQAMVAAAGGPAQTTR